MKVKFPIPFIKAMGLGFRGVSANHEDQVALNIAVNLLNNANGTGYLDKLMVEHKLMGALAINESMNEAGILAVAIMPKLLIQSYSSAEKMVWDEINRVKNGDFSDEMFNSLKLEQKRQYASSLENIDSRATVMMNLFSQGKSWNDYLNEVARCLGTAGIDAAHQLSAIIRDRVFIFRAVPQPFAIDRKHACIRCNTRCFCHEGDWFR